MKLKKPLLLPVAVLLIGLFSWGFVSQNQTKAPAKGVNWVSIEEAATLAKKDGKKILIDMYTDWCGWCKRMDRDTYAKADVIEYINENFHAVKFNAEQKESVTVNGVTYNYNGNVGRRGVHDLALQILNGRLSYPTTSFLNPDLSILTNVAGYQGEDDMMAILSFLGEDHYKTTSWEIYKKEYGAP
jgi:thioredoxin-related protein